MANYNCTIRTNYFHVKDNEKFEEFMTHILGKNLQVFHRVDTNGNKLYAFGCYDMIIGYFNSKDDYNNDEGWADAYEKFADGLSDCVAEDDAILIFESGHEGLHYVTGGVIVITSKERSGIDITNAAVEIARQILNNPDYVTQCRY